MLKFRGKKTPPQTNALTETKSKKNWFGKKWVRVVSVVVVACLAGGGVLLFHTLSASGATTSTTTFRLVRAQTGSVEKTISGTGTVSNASQDTLTAPDAGTVDSVSAKAGDTVTKGQTLLHINSTTAQQTLASKQSALQEAQEALASAEAEEDNLYIKAPLAGRIKAVQVVAGDTSTTINALGFLCYLSTSRSMTLTISSAQTSVTAGQAVNVKLSDGSTVSGTVSSASSSGGQGSSSGSGSTSGGSVTVTIGTDTPTVGSTATVTTASGATVGSGSLQLVSYYKITSSGSSSGSGNTGTTGSTTTGSSSSGTITNVYVTENQMVSKLQSLFKTDGTSVASDIASKQSAVTQAQQDVATAQAAVDANTITSPVSGTVLSVSVAAGDSVSSGTTLIEVMDPNAMETVVSVDEDDIGNVKTGQTAHVSLDAISGKTYTGTVTAVDQIGTNSNGVATFSVTVGISNPDNIKVGMSTDVEIVTQSVSNVVTISASALLSKMGTTAYVIPASKVTDSSGNTKTLTNVNTMQLVQKYGKKITTGLSNSNTVEVKNGLSDGDQIVIPVTVNLAAVKSLTSSQSTSSNSMMGGGMGGGFGGGMGSGGGGGFGGNTTRRSTGGTGNTTSAATTTSQATTASTATANAAGGGNGQ